MREGGCGGEGVGVRGGGVRRRGRSQCDTLVRHGHVLRLHRQAGLAEWETNRCPRVVAWSVRAGCWTRARCGVGGAGVLVLQVHDSPVVLWKRGGGWNGKVWVRAIVLLLRAVGALSRAKSTVEVHVCTPY